MMIAYGTAAYDAQVRLEPADPGAPPRPTPEPPRAAEPDDPPRRVEDPDTGDEREPADDEPDPVGEGPDDTGDCSGETEPGQEDRNILDQAWDGITGAGRALWDGLEVIRP
ncbi:MAG: hypothetical protein U5Q44_03765 [Dehalococcoidia bacterium]|nr:hypothetical protein [Dehalococcoidia bacterium]